MTDQSSTTCPFGCDEPWPHGPDGCVIRVSDVAWIELQKVLAEPPEPNAKIQELMKHYRKMLEA